MIAAGLLYGWYPLSTLIGCGGATWVAMESTASTFIYKLLDLFMPEVRNNGGELQKILPETDKMETPLKLDAVGLNLREILSELMKVLSTHAFNESKKYGSTYSSGRLL
jgi:hypothetical protein